MKRKLQASLASSALLLALSLCGAPPARAAHEGHDARAGRGDSRRAKTNVRAARRASKAGSRSQPGEVVYACPMHPDMQSHTPGECAKCGMALVASRPGPKHAAEAEGAAEPTGANRPRL